MQNYGIDGHKLFLHPQRVAQWLDGKIIYPLYMEISPSGACNHRCVFCTMDFMGYKTKFLDGDMICQRLQECGKLGVKAVMFAGEGEPLLNKNIVRMAETAKGAGIDVSFTTNAVFLKPETAKRLLPVTSWIKVSCNAGNAETYAATHGTDTDDFERVLRNMEEAVRIRQAEGYNCTLGFQCILLPENSQHMPSLARRVRDLGADYLVIKPYTHSPKILKNRYGDISYKSSEELAEQLRATETDTFKVVFRREAMQRWDAKTSAFDRCHALPFWAYVDAEANVWGCLRHLQEDDFNYGNLAENTFEHIWNSKRRLERVADCEQNMDVSECHVTCRMELINNYLWRLLNPQAHDNFI